MDSDSDSNSDISSNSNPRQEQKYFKVFQQDFYLSCSFDIIQQWSQKVIKPSMVFGQDSPSIDPFQYLTLQAHILQHEEYFLLAGYQVRYFAFTFYLDKAFTSLIQQYKKAYKNQLFDKEAIKKLDEKMIQLSHYLEKIELTRAVDYVTEIRDTLFSSIYGTLRILFPLVLQPYGLWRLLTFLELMRADEKKYVLNIPLNMKSEYYLKVFKTVKFKHQELTQVALQITSFLKQQKYLQAFIRAVQRLSHVKSEGPDDQQKCQFLCCLKYMYYSSSQQFCFKSNFSMEFLFASMQIPYYLKYENMPNTYYQELFYKILKQSYEKPQLLDMSLYIDPNIVERSPESFGKIQSVVLKMALKVKENLENFIIDKNTQPKQPFVLKLLDSQKIIFMVQFLESIMEVSASAFLKADSETYEIFLQMGEFLKNVFLSFGKDIWLFPQNIFSQLSLGFFKQISQDINDDLKNSLYQMVENLTANKMPQKVIFHEGKLSLEKVSRLEYLSVITYYIEDCSREDDYLNLPQIQPNNLQSCILLIKSLQVKLKHHEPNTAQLPLYKQYLRQCEKYKLNINFKWFQNTHQTFERETEFQIEAQLPCRQIREIFRECLNYRDNDYARKLIEEDHNNKANITAVELASRLKFNYGIRNLPQIKNMKQEDVFMLLQEMATMLAILPQDLFNMQLEDQVNVNYLHLMLTFYRSKIKEAKGSEIYQMLLVKIFLKYLQVPFSQTSQFRTKYPNFFQTDIYQYQQTQILSALNEQLGKFEQAKQKKEQQEIELAQKIKMVRERFLTPLHSQYEQLALFVANFTSLLSLNLPCKVFLQCLKLFVHVLSSRDSLCDIASLSVVLDRNAYGNRDFLQQLIGSLEEKYAMGYQNDNLQIQKKLLKHLLADPNLIPFCSLEQWLRFIQKTKQRFGADYAQLFNSLFGNMKQIADQSVSKIQPSWCLIYVYLSYLTSQQNQVDMRSMFKQMEQIKHKQISSNQTFHHIHQQLWQLRNNTEFFNQIRKALQKVNIKKYDFFFQLDKNLKKELDGEKKTGFGSIVRLVLKLVDYPTLTFYYAVNLNLPNLLKLHSDQNKVLVSLIKNECLTKDSYPIFKNIISQTENMTQILNQVLKNYQTEQNYPQNYQFHNKLILINERFPTQKVQQIILSWVQKGQSKLPLKIPQRYYIELLSEKLQKFPQKIGDQWLFHIHPSKKHFRSFEDQLDKLFSILLYLPIKKFENVYLANTENESKSDKHEDQGQWQDSSQEENIKIEQTKEVYAGDKNSSQEKEEQIDFDNDSQGSEDSEEENQQYLSLDLQLQRAFEEEEGNLGKAYRNMIKNREEIDVYLKSDYQKLHLMPIKDNNYIYERLLAIQKDLELFNKQSQQQITRNMPQQLYKALKQVGYQGQRDYTQIEKYRKPRSKLIRFKSQFFSERQESEYDQSDDSQMQNGSDMVSSIGSDIYDFEDNNYAIHSQNQIKEEENIQLPELNTQFSKVQGEITGKQLNKKDIIKILQVFLVQMFKMSPINFKKKQIVYSYIEIMESNFSQVFFESILTLLRMNENQKQNKNPKNYCQKLQNQLLKGQILQPQQKQKVSYFGLQELSKYNGLSNFCHLMKLMHEKNRLKEPEQDPFRKESGIILPIAEKFIIEFDLPLQSNLFSFILLHIQSNSKHKNQLGAACSTYGEQEETKLTKKQIKKICDLMLIEKAHFSTWQFIENELGHKAGQKDKLILCLDTYSKKTFEVLSVSCLKIRQAVQKNNQLLLKHEEENKSQITALKHHQRLTYIITNLLESCRKQTRQFYFMNKAQIRFFFDEDQDNNHSYVYNQIPQKLKKWQTQLFTNQNFINLVELACRVIFFVKKQLHGKISVKKFKRMIRIPKLILETATLYMHLSAMRKQKWNFKPIKTVNLFYGNYQMGQYKFKDLVQVYNLVLGLLEIESFSTGKFKQLLIPYFTKNQTHIGRDLPLMFKLPELQEDFQASQNIYVTRKCSFDMAFFQVSLDVIFVEFSGEEGSDHGGLIREFMMGWKGVGIGEEDFFFGKILGISFRQSVPYGGYVDLEMCISITNYKITLERLAELDKQLYQSLEFISQNDPQPLSLTFSISKKNPRSFEPQQFQLKPNGKEILVTEANKQEYIDLYLQKYYKVGRQHELEQVATGFYTVVLKEYAQLFKPNELMLHIRGQEICDINLLKHHVKYTEGYTETSVIIKWFWQILQTYNQEQMNKFVQFLTGSPKLPIFNPNFQITIERVFEIKNLPVAHTCFNTLDLPEYPTKQLLEEKLLLAIFEGNENFGIL